MALARKGGGAVTEPLQPTLYPLAFTLLLSFLSAAIGIIAFFIKDIRATLKEDQKRQDEEIGEVREEMSRLKASLPMHYVLRDDFLRAVAALDGKIDAISQDIREIARAVNQLIGGHHGGD